MIRHQSTKQISSRRGYTLVELLISMGTAAVLLVGLPSCIFIVSQAFSGKTISANRSETSEMQTDIVNDLKHALSFSELTANAVTMTVPDRDNNGTPEIIRYSWSGVAGDPLVYQFNSEVAFNIVDDVYDFNLTNITRFIAAPVIPDPEVIVADDTIFGFNTEFDNTKFNHGQKQIATQVTLKEAATLISITAYTDGGKEGNPYMYALYTDDNGEPSDLLVATDKGAESGIGWKTLPVTETTLTAGTYWLALAFSEDVQGYYYKNNDGQTRKKNYNPIDNGFIASWGSSNTNWNRKVSIYGTYTPIVVEDPADNSNSKWIW